MGIEGKVKKIIGDVKLRGDAALIFYTKKFDNIDIRAIDFRVKDSYIKKAFERLKKENAELYFAIRKAAENVKRYHEAQYNKIAKTWMRTNDGITTGERLTPIENIAVYVPGGRYSYPSSVLMSVIPAKVAGAGMISVFTPDRNITDAVLTAAYLSGADNVFRLGGAQAIAAAAYGTESIPKADLIVGPGNIYVTEAKKQLFGVAGIDMLAGPSEVVIIADKTASPDIIAEDLLAQAEHDPFSKSFMLSDSKKLINDVKKIIPVKYKKQIFYEKSSLNDAVKRSNEIAPEHLEVFTFKPEKLLRKITNAGAIFLGEQTPTALGDYFAGPSHVLPTGATAKFSGGLSVMTFLKRISIIKSSKNGIKSWRKYVSILAKSEGLKHHACSAEKRKTFVKK